MVALNKSPLLDIIANNATILVVKAEGNPYISKLSSIGTPVKSNLSVGIHGKGILKPLYFKA
jgi:hypothetical protein